MQYFQGGHDMKCPGQDSRYWKPGAIFEVDCPGCGRQVEFFKDDTTRKCPHCGHRFVNPKMDFGCAAYCQFAEQCIGTLPPEVVAQQENLLKDRVALEMKRYLQTDFRQIGHATRVARYAEKIGIAEKANPAVIISAAYLNDIGISEAQRKFGSTDPKYHEAESVLIARLILTKLGAAQGLIDEVCDIISHHHHPRPEETMNFKVLFDADLIATVEENQKNQPVDKKQIQKIIETSCFTETGKKIAQMVLIEER
jgi:hypothetical protein